MYCSREEDMLSNIDEIVLAYLVGVVELASQGDDGTDFEDVLDMMNAYLPGFEKIDRSDVIQWMFGLADKLASKEIVTDGVSLEQPVEPHTRAMPVTDNVPNGDCESQLHSMTQRRTFPLYDFSNSVAISGQQTTVKSLSHSCQIASDHQPSNLSKDKLEGTVSPQMKDKSTEDGQRIQRHPNSKPNNFHSDSFNEKKSRSKRKSRQLSCSSQESQEDSAVRVPSRPSPTQSPTLNVRSQANIVASLITVCAHVIIDRAG
ncbi:hypothetical protein EGW08_013438 [Elysia chlorotica]|uniref:Uncharacterized protein n=1 Tax=Elysia chlorotica TaxID=188477 RepID=A0A3S0ZZ54_ELYCH|nr:hypothetical protein EGW08_013438 [Elysia chlorotica]